MLLENLVRSGNEKQRSFGSGVLAEIRAGQFDPLKLRIENKERYFLGENPIITISILNSGSDIKKIKAAEYQKFSLELKSPVENGSLQKTMTCSYNGIPQEPQGFPETLKAREESQKRTQPASKFVKLSEIEETNLILDLSACFRSQLSIGKYTLTVQTLDGEEFLKGQSFNKNFEVYFDEIKSVIVLAEILKSYDLSRRDGAFSQLLKFDKKRLIIILEELIQTGNENQRNFASGKLADLKAGRL